MFRKIWRGLKITVEVIVEARRLAIEENIRRGYRDY